MRDLDRPDTASAPLEGVTIRRELHPEDLEAIVAQHKRIYGREYGLDERFVQGVRDGVDRAVAAGWPEQSGAVWIPEIAGRFAGSVGLTYEGNGVGWIRWVLLEPELRGSGIGRRLLGEAVETARESGWGRLELCTFDALRAAGHLYCELGFEVTDTTPTDRWGPVVNMQIYTLALL